MESLLSTGHTPSSLSVKIDFFILHFQEFEKAMQCLIFMPASPPVQNLNGGSNIVNKRLTNLALISTTTVDSI